MIADTNPKEEATIKIQNKYPIGHSNLAYRRLPLVLLDSVTF